MEKTIGVDRRRTLPQWTRQTFEQQRRRTAAIKAARHQAIADRRPAAVCRHVHGVRDPGDRRSRPSSVMQAAGLHPALAPNVLLRPAADFARACSARRAARRRPTCTRCTIWPRAATPSCSWSQAACRRCRKMRRRCCAASCSIARASSPRVRAVRGVSRARMRRRPRHFDAQAGPGQHTLAPALPSAIDGPGGAGQGAAVARARRDGDRSRSRLLRHGGVVRVHARSLRRVARDRRAQAAAGGPRARRATRCWSPPARRAVTRCTISPA